MRVPSPGQSCYGRNTHAVGLSRGLWDAATLRSAMRAPVAQDWKECPHSHHCCSSYRLPAMTQGPQGLYPGRDLRGADHTTCVCPQEGAQG